MQLDSSIAAVVTGGASGLGAATARRLAGHGVKVALFDLNAEQGEALAKELGGIFCKVDVTSEEQVDAAFAKARAAHGQERVLVNCAGTGNAVKTASRDKATGEIKHFPPAGESTDSIRERVVAARERAMQRQGHANQSLHGAAIDRHAALDDTARAFMFNAAAKLGWSARSTHRALKVARTIADLAGSEAVQVGHLAEAVQYRRALRGAT